MMRKYCKAYYLNALRRFPGWMEKHEEDEAELTDDSIVYLWDDFTVVRSPVIPNKGLVFDTLTEEWKDFCHNNLQFEIPEDLRYAYEEAQEAGDTPDEATEQVSSH